MAKTVFFLLFSLVLVLSIQSAVGDDDEGEQNTSEFSDATGEKLVSSLEKAAEKVKDKAESLTQWTEKKIKQVQGSAPVESPPVQGLSFPRSFGPSRLAPLDDGAADSESGGSETTIDEGGLLPPRSSRPFGPGGLMAPETSSDEGGSIPQDIAPETSTEEGGLIPQDVAPGMAIDEGGLIPQNIAPGMPIDEGGLVPQDLAPGMPIDEGGLIPQGLAPGVRMDAGGLPADMPSAEGGSSADMPSTEGGSSADMPSTEGGSSAEIPSTEGGSSSEIPSSGGSEEDVPEEEGDSAEEN